LRTMLNMKPDEISLFLSDEILAAFADNKINLVEELQNNGLDVERLFVGVSSDGKGGRTRDAAIILVASGVALTLLSSGIAKVIDALGRNKKVLVNELAFVPVLDGGGQPVRDEADRVVGVWTEKARLLEASETKQEQSTLQGSIGVSGLSFEFKSGE